MRLQNAAFPAQPLRAAREDASLQNRGRLTTRTSDQSLENWDLGPSRHLDGGAVQCWVSARLCLQYPAPIGRALKRATSEAEL